MENNAQYLVDPNEALKEFYTDRRLTLSTMLLSFMVQILMTVMII